jgi:hypothetical protein
MSLNTNKRLERFETRIKTELLLVLKMYKKIWIEYEFNEILVKIDDYEIIITNDYPFQMPIVKWKNRLFSQLLKPPTVRITKLIYDLYHICLCCETMFSLKYFWFPTHNVVDVLNEIERIRKIKTNVKYHIVLPEIATKFQLPIELQYFMYRYLCV